MGERALNRFQSDKALREDCAAIYEALGTDLNAAFRIFMERTRMARGFRFPPYCPKRKRERRLRMNAPEETNAEREMKR